MLLEMLILYLAYIQKKLFLLKLLLLKLKYVRVCFLLYFLLNLKHLNSFHFVFAFY